MRKTTSKHPLAVERQRLNLSQKMLADFTGLGLSTIIRAERGEPIRADSRQRLCEHFNKTATELGLIRVEADNMEDDASNCDISRRQALQFIGAGVALFAGNQTQRLEPWKQLSLALNRPRINPETINHLYSITQSYWDLRANIRAQELLWGVQGHLQTTSQLFNNSLTSESRKDLCSVAGEIALIAGQICFDMNEYQTAQQYYKTGVEAGTEGNNIDLQCAALGRMSFIYLECHQFQQAYALVSKAQKLAMQGRSHIIQCWLKAIEAEIHANMQNDTPCMLALEDAHKIAAIPKLDSDIYKTGFNNARLAGYKGICYVQLQKPQLALEALTESLEIDSQSMRHKLRVTIDMAMAYAQQGELEKGCSLASMALNTTKQAGTLMILPRLQKFRQIVEPWRNSKHVREFDEQLLLA